MLNVGFATIFLSLAIGVRAGIPPRTAGRPS